MTSDTDKAIDSDNSTNHSDHDTVTNDSAHEYEEIGERDTAAGVANNEEVSRPPAKKKSAISKKQLLILLLLLSSGVFAWQFVVSELEERQLSTDTEIAQDKQPIIVQKQDQVDSLLPTTDLIEINGHDSQPVNDDASLEYADSSIQPIHQDVAVADSQFEEYKTLTDEKLDELSTQIQSLRLMFNSQVSNNEKGVSHSEIEALRREIIGAQVIADRALDKAIGFANEYSAEIRLIKHKVNDIHEQTTAALSDANSQNTQTSKPPFSLMSIELWDWNKEYAVFTPDSGDAAFVIGEGESYKEWTVTSIDYDSSSVRLRHIADGSEVEMGI